MRDGKAFLRGASGLAGGLEQKAGEPEKGLCALLLSVLDDSLSVERSALRQAGVLRVRTIASGAQGLELIAGQLSGKAAAPEAPVDLIVCTENMADMEMPVFLRELGALCHQHHWRMPPILAVTGEADSEARLLAWGAGAVLVRPYALSALGESLRRLLAEPWAEPEAEPGRPLFEESIAMPVSSRKLTAVPSSLQGHGDGGFFAFRQRGTARKPAGLHKDESPARRAEAALAGPASDPVPGADLAGAGPVRTADGPAVDPTPPPRGMPFGPAAFERGGSLNPLLLTRKGLALMRDGKLADAEQLLRQALDYDGLDLEAGLGLARVCARQGDRAGEIRWLNRAAIICLETGQKERAEDLQARIPENEGADPYLLEARHLLCEEDYEAAAEALLQAGLRHNTPLHELVGRASQFTDSPEFAIRALCDAFIRSGHQVTAANLRHRLLSDGEPDFYPAGLFAKFPKLYEAYAVARYTVQAWRQAAAN